MEQSEKFETSKKANELRKAGEFAEAQKLYETIWQDPKNKYVGAGLLHCLRKQENYQKAVPLATEIECLFKDFDWARNEVIWTMIQAKLLPLAENGSLSEVVAEAQLIMNLRPENIAAKLTVFTVLKAAKEAGKWDVVKEWTEKIDPDSLTIDPMRLDNGRDGWSDQAKWYNFRINALIETENAANAVLMLEELIQKFPGQRKFFLRLKALALHKIGQSSDAEVLYSDLCKGERTDWWLLDEYAIVVRDLGRKEEALKLMCRAALSNSKLEMMVSMFVDIGNLCLELGKVPEARDHFLLSKLVREKNGWSIPHQLASGLTRSSTLPDSENPAFPDLLQRCKAIWISTSGDVSLNELRTVPLIQKNLQGKVILGPKDRQFCFIKATSVGDVFCFKSDLPGGIRDGDMVQFDAAPSFDKKKNRHGLKGQNVRCIQHLQPAVTA